MGLLSNLFGGKRKQEIIDALDNGAKIIDVRTIAEFKTGNIEGSVNIPIEKFNQKTIKRIKNLKTPVIVCCASGSRSVLAKRKLQEAGIEVVNGGSWFKVHRIMAA